MDKQLKRQLKETFPDAQFHKDGTVTARKSYFYHNGYTVEKYEQRVRDELTKLNVPFEIVETRDAWKAWPTTSYLKVRFRVQPAPLPVEQTPVACALRRKF